MVCCHWRHSTSLEEEDKSAWNIEVDSKIPAIYPIRQGQLRPDKKTQLLLPPCHPSLTPTQNCCLQYPDNMYLPPPLSPNAQRCRLKHKEVEERTRPARGRTSKRVEKTSNRTGQLMWQTNHNPDQTRVSTPSDQCNCCFHAPLRSGKDATAATAANDVVPHCKSRTNADGTVQLDQSISSIDAIWHRNLRHEDIGQAPSPPNPNAATPCHGRAAATNVLKIPKKPY